MKGFRKQTQKAVKLISDCFEHRPFLRWYCSTPGRGRSSENTCSRAPFRLGCGDAQGAGGEADLVFRKVWRSEGTVFPHCPPEAPGHGKLRGGRSTASLEEENRLLPKRHHLRAGSQPCVTWCWVAQKALSEKPRIPRVSCSVASDPVAHGLWPTRPLCPWDSPGKSTGVGCCFLLQECGTGQKLNSENKTKRTRCQWSRVLCLHAEKCRALPRMTFYSGPGGSASDLLPHFLHFPQTCVIIAVVKTHPVVLLTSGVISIKWTASIWSMQFAALT